MFEPCSACGRHIRDDGAASCPFCGRSPTSVVARRAGLVGVAGAVLLGACSPNPANDKPIEPWGSPAVPPVTSAPPPPEPPAPEPPPALPEPEPDAAPAPSAEPAPSSSVRPPQPPSRTGRDGKDRVVPLYGVPPGVNGER